MPAFKYGKIPFYDGVKMSFLKINNISNFLLKKVYAAGKVQIPAMEEGSFKLVDYNIPARDMEMMKVIIERRKI